MSSIVIRNPELSDGLGVAGMCIGIDDAQGKSCDDCEVESQQALSSIKEFKVVQGLLKISKHALTLHVDCLREQGKMWLKVTEIHNRDQRDRIKMAIEKHCHTPARWLSVDEIEINIHPDERVFHQS